MRCRYSGKALMNLSVMVIAAWMVITSIKWPLRTSIFILVMGIPVFFMAMLESYLNLFGKAESDGETKGEDSGLPEGMDKEEVKTRTLSIFLWIIGFFFLICLVSFPIAVPLFLLLFLKLRCREGWGISLTLVVAGWGCFYGLFVHLIHLPFPEGWVQQALRLWLRGSF